MISPAMLLTAAALSAAAGCLPIEGKFITASLVAEVDPAFGALRPETVLAHAPVPGMPRALSAAELNAVLAKHGATPAAAEGRCFEYSVSPLVRDRLMEPFHAALRERFPESGKWRSEIVAHSQAPAPAGAVTFYPVSSISPDAAGGSRTYRGYISYADDRRFPIWARIRLLVEEPRIVATRDLSAGVPVPREAIREDRRTVPAPGSGRLWDLDAVAGKVPIRVVPADSTLDPALLRSAPQVARGDRVNVEVRTGGARLSLAGRAESGGRFGDRIAVLNESSGKRFMATVTNPGSALVDLNGGRSR